MKQFLFVISIGMLCSCSSFNNQSAGSKVNTVAEKNIATTNAIDKAFLTGDVGKLGDYIAADAVDHSSKGDIKGIDSIKTFFANLHAISGDMKHQILKELADSDYVFQWMRVWGTNSSETGVLAGTKYDITIIGVTKFKDGKSTEYWEFVQKADMMKHPGDNAW